MRHNFFSAKIFYVLLSLTLVLSAQSGDLQSGLNHYISQFKADVGIAAKNFSTGEVIILNGEKCYPMQSVYKFPLALVVLDMVDKGDFSLEQMITISKDELLTDTWSPLREKYGQNDVSVSLAEILEYTVSYSDNNGCDILFRLIGGTKVAHEYFKVLGIENLNIVATEAEMHADWDVQFQNCSTPATMLAVLEKYYSGELLSIASYDFLWKIMSAKKFGLKRIQGELPEDVIVAHKTGTSGTNEAGIAAATNDAGVIVSSGGEAIGIVVYVSNSTEQIEVREKIIATVSRMIWDEFTKEKK